MARRLKDVGCAEISLGDTIGVGVPSQVPEVVGQVVQSGVRREEIALHFHDTRGTALANVVQGLREGVRIFDSSAAGLGGCPFAPGAAGNLATEDLVYMLHGMGYATGVSLEGVFAASSALFEVLKRRPASRVFQAMEAALARTPGERAV